MQANRYSEGEFERLARTPLARECARLDSMARMPRGEIRWADLNPVRGLIPSHDLFNDRPGTVIAVALTSQEPLAGFR